MNHNLFLSLRKYRPREGNDPLENYVTAAFGWILNNHDDFSVFILNKLCNLLKYSEILAPIKWSTQVHFNGFYPDMVCEFNGNNAFVFENKVWSPLHSDQLSNYRNQAKQHYGEHRLILITANSSQHKQNPDLALCWKDIFQWTEEWLKAHKGNNSMHCIFQDFLNLLEYLGLGFYPPVSSRLDRSLLQAIMTGCNDALTELNCLAEKGLICKTETKKQDSETWDVFYRLKGFYFDNEIGLRGKWLNLLRPCLKWANAIRKNEYLNLDDFTYLNQNLAMLEPIDFELI